MKKKKNLQKIFQHATHVAVQIVSAHQKNIPRIFNFKNFLIFFKFKKKKTDDEKNNDNNIYTSINIVFLFV